MASGDTLVVFMANNNEPPSASFATLDTRAGASDAEHLVLDFDAASDESSEFGAVMPRNYSATTGLTVTIGWMASSATSGDCVWDVSFKSVSDDADDLDTKEFAAVNSVAATAASASGEVQYSAVTFTDGADMDSVAAGEYFRMRITRDANNGSDTMSGDAELLFVEIQDT